MNWAHREAREILNKWRRPFVTKPRLPSERTLVRLIATTLAQYEAASTDNAKLAQRMKRERDEALARLEDR